MFNDTDTKFESTIAKIDFGNVAEFHQLKKNYFDSILKRKKSLPEHLKDINKYFSLQLPVNLGEVLLLEELSGHYWIANNTFVDLYEKELLEKIIPFRIKHTNLKTYFKKVILNDDPKKNDANAWLFFSTVKSLQGNNYMFPQFLQALVYLFGPRKNIDYQAAIEELNKVEKLLADEQISQKSKNIFSYYVFLYSGYSLMKVEDFEAASEYLRMALDINPFGVSAKFYLALCLIKLNYSDQSFEFVEKLIRTDSERLKYAVAESNPIMFEYFISNPLSPYLLRFEEFALLTGSIETTYRNMLANSIGDEEILKKIVAVSALRFDEYYDQQVISNISFLQFVISENRTNRAYFYRISIPWLAQKFYNIIERIESKIKDEYYQNYYKELQNFDSLIEESGKTKSQLELELEKFREEIKKKMKVSITQLEDYIAKSIQVVEEGLEKVNQVDKYNPAVAFKNSITYNVVVSIIVFAIGGIAGYFNNSQISFTDLYSMTSTVVLAGLKWSSLTFIIGVIVSAFISVLVVGERTNYKQKLKRRIVDLKHEREASVDIIKKESNVKEKSVIENFTERIDHHIKRVESLKAEKITFEKELKRKADESMKPILDKLNKAVEA